MLRIDETEWAKLEAIRDRAALLRGAGAYEIYQALEIWCREQREQQADADAAAADQQLDAEQHAEQPGTAAAE
jgi:hypothetical protein